ncbi:hypothetical protein SAMN04487857_11486 [Pseudomonas sp. ok272]|uniref:hypothetical protein n=1 Tax=unclassified Pseudomonas TaxID=196821 RepID=UPI0008C6787F|nr:MULTISPECIES: hypothetical protein [unclassified Pseudomonas]SEN35622.1 hypothetical protein SAMN04487857_11486 [Pseudomonas sp. ok272]SFM83200.1 hypothetical protein SAMN04487858_107147 [Pseudomonas sp. ok602]
MPTRPLYALLMTLALLTAAGCSASDVELTLERDMLLYGSTATHDALNQQS